MKLPILPPEDDGYVHWFGESWGAPACEAEFHEPTPVGAQCWRCGRLIEADTQGVSMIHLSMDKPPERMPAHLDCYLATMLPPEKRPS